MQLVSEYHNLTTTFVLLLLSVIKLLRISNSLLFLLPSELDLLLIIDSASDKHALVSAIFVLNCDSCCCCFASNYVYSSVPNNRPPPRLLIFEKFSNPPIFIPTPLLLILVTKTQTVQIFWTIFLANVITHYHYTVCKVNKQYIVRLAISRSIFERFIT